MVRARELLQIKVEVGIAAIEGRAIVLFSDRLFVPRDVPSWKPEAGLGGAHETVGSRRRVFEKGENAQGITFGEREPFGLGDIRFGLR